MSFILLAILSACVTFASPDFPQAPDQNLTPGSLCAHPNSYRYKEKIPYCERNVTAETKEQVIRNYDAKLGFHIEKMARGDFKIDHYIPLCMGGSNDPSNLWPQHKSIYQITDALEQISCEKMEQGALLQARAIAMMREGKNNLAHVPALIREIEALH